MRTTIKPNGFLALAALGLTLTAQPASADLNCADYEGHWQGNMKMDGSYNGATSMIIKNCRITWTLPGGDLNKCRLRERKGRIEYFRCSRKSHGIATLNGNRLNLQNVFTAKKHGAYVVNVERK